MLLKDLMKTPVTTIGPDETLHVADGIMALGGLRHLPVVTAGALVGILTHRDILRAPTTYRGPEARDVLKALSVKDMMTREVVTIDVNAALRDAAARLLKYRVGCLPVVERGALVGIVTTSDLLQAIVGRRENPTRPDNEGVTGNPGATVAPTVPTRSTAPAMGG